MLSPVGFPIGLFVSESQVEMANKAQASPTKEFFVHMITKDISLDACILDLLDNSIDGARRSTISQKGDSRFEGYWAAISLDDDHFEIRDNCGGIPREVAEKYAFHFGRPPEAPSEADYAIGLYGIGMKRAVLKMGESTTVISSTGQEQFQVEINVPKWLAKKTDWDFPLRDSGNWDGDPGTLVSVTDLRDGAAAELGDSEFARRLREEIARDYSFFLQKGFRIRVNGRQVTPYGYQLKANEGELEPARVEYVDEGVTVRITAGMAAPPPDDLDPEELERKETDYYGWFIVCNDRVVVAANKDRKTIWGDGGFAGWHGQYNGFMGIAEFSSSDPALLPWDTTKRDVEASDPVYRRAVSKMKKLTRPFIRYTSQRKDALEVAKTIEARAPSVPFQELQPKKEMILPKLPEVQRIKMTSIQYRVPEPEILKVKEAFGDKWMSNREVGVQTYKYYVERNVEL